MPSYKIHSLKNNKKLSFIIEGETSGMIEQKLSNEGYIVLSVEEVKTDETTGYFCFEGKKQDGSFITGKISAETIFQAYEMLTKEYAYILDKLYPSHIEDVSEQEKIFTQLQYSFQREVVKKIDEKKDTSQEHVEKNKKSIEQIINYLTTIDIAEKEKIVTELRRIQQMNNNSAIEQTLKGIVQNIYDLSPDKKNIDPVIKTVASSLHIFLAPPVFLSMKKMYRDFMDFIAPVMQDDTERVLKKTEEKIRKVSLDDPHINKLLQAEYRKNIIGWIGEGSLAFFYTVLREKKSVFFLKKTLQNTVRISMTSVMVLIFWAWILSALWYYPAFFFTSEVVGILLIIIVASLVFPDQTV